MFRTKIISLIKIIDTQLLRLLSFSMMLILASCNPVANKSAVDDLFAPGILLSDSLSTIVSNQQTLTNGSSTTLSVTLMDQNRNPYFNRSVTPTFELVGGSSQGVFNNINLLSPGRFTVDFFAKSSGTPVKIKVNYGMESITSTVQLQVLPGVGVSISNAQNSFINLANVSSFSLNGFCSENGEQVQILAGGTSQAATCTGNSFSSIIDFTGFSEGPITVSVTHQNSFAEQASASRSFIKDTIAPSASITSTPAVLVNTQTTSFSFSATDATSGLSSFQCSLDGIIFTSCSSPTSYSGLSDGTYTFFVRALDNAGNTSANQTYNWQVDILAPSISITTPSTLRGGQTGSVSWTVTEPNATVANTFSVELFNGTSWSSIGTVAGSNGPLVAQTFSLSGFSVPLVTVGTARVRITYTDAAGNTQVSTGAAFSIDSTPVSVTLDNAAGSFITTSNQGALTISGTCSENGRTVSLTGSITASATCNSGSYSTVLNMTALANGNITITATHANTYGESASLTRTLVKDTVVPTISITSNPTALTNLQTASFSFSATDATSGVASYLCSIDAGVFSSCNSPAVYTSLIHGAHTFTVKSVDNAGNTSATASYTWSIDIVPPALSFSTPGTLSGAQTTSLTWTVTEANASSAKSYLVEFFNGSAWSTVGTVAGTSGNLSSQSFTLSNFTVPTGNSNAARVRITNEDSLGNSTTQTSSAFILDSTAPTASAILAYGSTTTALPQIIVQVSGTDPSAGGVASGITQMQISESSTPATNGWVNYATQRSLTLTQTNGTKTVYVWTRDAAGNPSVAWSGTIYLDFGAPPTVSVTNPVAGDFFIIGDSVNIDWTCSSSNGLDPNPISFIRYTIDDGVNFFDIGTNITNNISSTSGRYTWTVPSTAPTTPTPTSMLNKYFRILIGCKSAAGVINTSYSQPISTGGWSIFMGDPTYNLRNVNASIANVSSAANYQRGSLTEDKDGNIYYVRYNGIMRIDAVTGLVTLYAGTVETAGCTLATGQPVLGAGTNLMNTPFILGTDPAGESMFVTSFAGSTCPRIYKIRFSDSAVLNTWTLPTSTGFQAFLAAGRYVIYPNYNFTNPQLYSLDLGNNSSTPVLIHGSGTLATAAPTLNSNALSANMAGPGQNWYTFMATPDLKKIWVRGQYFYRLDDPESDGTYIIGQTGLSWPTDVTLATATRFDNKIYIAPRSVGRSIGVFNLDTESFETVRTLPFVNNDGSGYLSLGSGNTKLISHYSLNTIHSIDTTNLANASAYTIVAGQPFSTFGNGNDPTKVAFGDPFHLKYFPASKKLYVSNTGHFRIVDMSAAPYQTSTRTIDIATGKIMGFNLAETLVVSNPDTCGSGQKVFSWTMSTLASAGSFMNSICGSTLGYPVADPASAASVGTYFRWLSNMNVTNSYLPHSNGKLYFSASNGASDILIFSSDRTNIRRVAGTTGAGGYLSGDHGTAALGARLTNVKLIQEISSGTYAGDLLIWDGNLLRRISLASQNAGDACPVSGVAPCIYDVLDYRLAAGFTAGTTFADAYYDESSEISGVLGSGITYYVTSSNTVRKFLPTSVSGGTVFSATDTAYVFNGTTLSGTVRIALTPDGLLVLQPSKNRILRVPP